VQHAARVRVRVRAASPRLLQHGVRQGPQVIAQAFHPPINAATVHASSGCPPVASGSDALLPTMRAMAAMA